MKAVEFDQVNIKIAEHQDEYQTLPAHFNKAQGTVTACFELDEAEKQQVAEEGKIYITLWTGGQSLQPIHSSVLNPYNPQPNQEDQ